MKKKTESQMSPVTIESGPASWQILQQDRNGAASVTLSGRWWTIMKRKTPEVRLRLCREGGFSAISKRHDWSRATTLIDTSVKGAGAGRSGTWTLTLKNIPCGGPYRMDTCIGSAEDAIEWRRGGDTVHFLGVGDVWLIAGQSNAEGYGREPVDDPSEIGVHQFGADAGWQLAAHGCRHSPGLAFGKKLRHELGYPIGLIPTAVGGSSMSQWDPGQNGELYEAMKCRLAASGTSIKGVFWYQGEGDTQAVDSPKYKTRFTRFLKGLRKLARQPQLPIITVQLNRLLSGDNGQGWEAMREIQRQLSHDLDHTFVISIFESVLCDGIHNGSLGNLLIAQRAADTAMGGVYGKDTHFRHPECVSAKKVSAKVIDLTFDHVITRLTYECALSNGFPFAVRDQTGEVPVEGYRLPRKNVFRILLARPLIGPATVTGVPGSCTPHVVPRDISGYRGILGFTMAVAEK